MTERSQRFRRLAPGQTGDLFEHYGIELEPRRPPPAEAIVPSVAKPCCSCGWYVTSGQAATACPICAEPSPWGTQPDAERPR